jgi:hypothetical protein
MSVLCKAVVFLLLALPAVVHSWLRSLTPVRSTDAL